MNTEIPMFYGLGQQGNGKPQKQPLPAPKKAPDHPTQKHLKALDKKLPKADESGRTCEPQHGLTGHKAKKTRTHFANNCALDEFLLENPHFVPHPRKRAEKKKQGRCWSSNDMKHALNEFCIPAGMKVVITCPELCNRDLLAVSEKCKAQNGSGAGHMSPCPRCSVNACMRIDGWTTHRPSCQKVMNQQLTQDVVVGATLACHNVDCGCCERIKKGKKGNQTREKPSRCTSCVGEIWKQCPDSVRRGHLDCTQDMEDRETELMMSPGCADRPLFNKGSFEDFARSIKDAMNLLDQAALKSCRDFAMEEAEKFPEKLETTPDGIHEKFRSMKWPLCASTHGALKCFKAPCADTVITMFHCLCEKVEPCPLRDLFNRHGGRMTRVDGTFNAMKRTMDTPDAEDPNNALVKILGECNHVLTFAFCGAEGNMVKERLCWCLRLRCLRLGGPEALCKMVAGCDDLCCNNGDPKKHWLTALFPKCVRGFIKDMWHAVEQVKRERPGVSDTTCTINSARTCGTQCSSGNPTRWRWLCSTSRRRSLKAD